MQVLAMGVVGGMLPTPLPRGADTAWARSSTSEERLASQIFRDAIPSVVSVARSRRPGERWRRESADEDGLPTAIGSGFVWDADHVVTNYHVVREVGAQELMVIFSNTGASPGEELPQREALKAELLGADPATDTAVLRVVGLPAGRPPKSPIRALARGESSTLEVGQTVYAIGNPFGLEHSMSRGIISGIARTLDIGERPIRGCIQTDASINPGNSGGPLLDSQGRVVGVNTAILTGSGTSAGVGLAIPIDTVGRNVEAILRQGFVQRAFLGITLAPDLVSEQLQLAGLVVVAVVPGSPAEAAGVRPTRDGTLGDVVVALDGQPVRAGADFFRVLDKRKPGDSVTMEVRRPKRGGEEGTEDVLLNTTLSAKDGFRV